MNKCKWPFVLLVLLFTIYSFGQNDEDYKSWENHIDSGIQLLDSENYQDALKQLEEAYTIAQKIFTKSEEEYGDTVYNLAENYALLGDYKKAIPYYLETLHNLKVNKLEYEPYFTDLLFTVAELYSLTSDYDNSIKTLFQILKIIESNNDKDNLEYSQTLNMLSIVYKKIGDYENAIKYNEISNTIIEKLYGVESEQYALNSTSLSQIYIELGDYNKALLILDKVLPLLKKLNPKSNAYMHALFTKGLFYSRQYEYDKEILLYEEVKAISNESDNAYISANNNLSVAYQEMGDYDNALTYVLEVTKNTTENDPNHPVRFQNLAYLYGELGELDKSLENYEIALASCKNKLGTSHPQYAELIDCIGQLYVRKDDLVRAKDLFKEALSIFLKTFDENHSKYGFYLNNYTGALLELNQNQEAIDLIKKNIKISENNLNLDNIDYYRKQLNLAKAYNKIGNYNEAVNILEKYSKKTKQKLGNEHLEYENMLKSLGDAYLGLGNLEKAIPVLDSFNSAIISQIDKVFKFRSEKEKKSFLKITNQNFDELQSIAYQLNNPINELNEINLNNQIMLKGLLLNNSKNLLSELSSLNNSDVNNKILSYKSVKAKLVSTLSLPFERRVLNIDSLNNIISIKESELVKLYSTNFDSNINSNQSWGKSQLKLNKNEVAIEFSRFNYSKKNKLTDSVLYVAYVFKKDSEYPQMIPLFEEKQLKSILSKKSPNQLYVSRGSKAKSINNTKAIFDLVWNPLEKYVEKSSKVYYAPSGLLNQISFAALGKKGDETLSEKYNLFQLSTTGTLTNDEIITKTENALFIGGIDYNYAISSKEKIAEDSLVHESKKTSNYNEKNRVSWKFLEGSLKEVEDLQVILESQGSKVDRWSGKEATETNFKKLSGNSPNILHIATHGFFYENLDRKPENNFSLSTEDQYRLAEDPLMRSGLLFAGANHTWKHGHNSSQDEDGILTAMEISNMDLSNTDIVVLSACETGLGDIDGSEGVYGLQRAFKMAGVNIIVMSLWEVPDIETAEFMSLFYSNWMQNNKVKEAFNKAQRTMQNKYADKPEKWAAFVLFE